jgi:hypothetical protein
MAKENAQPENVPVDAPQLSFQDIASVVQIIDICSKRGGFEGPELAAVGGVRNRIVSFLNATAKEGEVPEGELPVQESPEEKADAKDGK